MRQSLQNNRKLLKKHGLFKPLSESYNSPHNPHYKYSEGLKFKESTPEQMELLRAQLHELNMVRRLRFRLYIAFSAIMILLFLGWMTKTPAPRFTKEEKAAIRLEKSNWTKEMLSLQNEIDIALLLSNWPAAMKAAKHALDFETNNRTTKQKLAFATKMVCLSEGKLCAEAEKQIAALVDHKHSVTAKTLNENIDSHTIELLVMELVNMDALGEKTWPIH